MSEPAAKNPQDSSSLPTNIKQIGTIGDGLRVYVEDYVCTYLQQYAEAGGYDERIALLIGRTMVIDGQAVLFISGAVQGRHTEVRNGLPSFTEKSGEYAQSMIDEYFKGMEVVGWMQSQPGYGISLNQQHSVFHMVSFPKEYHVLFVMDPLERANAFYTYNGDKSGLSEAQGYFIYYDKNQAMQDYMIKHKVEDQAEANRTLIDSYLKAPDDQGIRQPLRSYRSAPTDFRASKSDAAPAVDEQPMPSKMALPRHTGAANKDRFAPSLLAPKAAPHEQRRTMNLLVSLSAVLFIICFVMGAGLIQNQDRISLLEEQIIQLSTAYRNMYLNNAPENITSVFAAQQDGADDSNESEQNAASGSVIRVDGNDELAASERDANDEAIKSSAQNTPTDEEPFIPSPTASDPINEGNQATQTLVPTPTTTPTVVPTQAPDPGDDASKAASSEDTPRRIIPTSYTIQPGDNLNWISTHFYGDKSMVPSILALNDIEDANKITAGRTILLP